MSAIFIQKTHEYGTKEALYGLGLSHGITSNIEFDEFVSFYNNKELEKRILDIANKLCCMEGGHNKFLETICVWFIITAPRLWWQEFDTYRVGVTKQSQSTIHTISKRDITPYDFDTIADIDYLRIICEYINNTDSMIERKAMLPESFMQKRVVCTNYKALRNIYKQRKSHKLEHWRKFCNKLVSELCYPDWITK